MINDVITCGGGGEGEHLRGDLVRREVVLFQEVKLLLLGLLEAVDGIIDGTVVGTDVECAFGEDEPDGEVGHGLTRHEGQGLLGRGVLGGLTPPSHTLSQHA